MAKRNPIALQLQKLKKKPSESLIRNLPPSELKNRNQNPPSRNLENLVLQFPNLESLAPSLALAAPVLNQKAGNLAPNPNLAGLNLDLLIVQSLVDRSPSLQNQNPDARILALEIKNQDLRVEIEAKLGSQDRLRATLDHRNQDQNPGPSPRIKRKKIRMEGGKETPVAVLLVVVKMKKERIRMILRFGRKRMESRRRDLIGKLIKTTVEVILILVEREKLEIKGEAFLQERIGKGQRIGIDRGIGHVIGIEGKK